MGCDAPCARGEGAGRRDARNQLRLSCFLSIPPCFLSPDDDWTLGNKILDRRDTWGVFALRRIHLDDSCLIKYGAPVYARKNLFCTRITYITCHMLDL